jgi:hypothetical protein
MPAAFAYFECCTVSQPPVEQTIVVPVYRVYTK